MYWIWLVLKLAHCHLQAESLPACLQVLNFSAGMHSWKLSLFHSLILFSAITIIAARSFWLQCGPLPTADLFQSLLTLYCESGIAHKVQVVIWETFGDTILDLQAGQLDGNQVAAKLLPIVLANQLSMLIFLVPSIDL